MSPVLGTIGAASIRGFGMFNFTAGGNYLGNGSDGSLTVASNTSLVVPNKVGSYDGDMVVKQYTDLTINSGVTLTVDQACRGLFIYVKGNCTINGTLSMTGKGAFANPTIAGSSDSTAVNATGLRYGFAYTGGTDTLTMTGSEFNGCGTAVKTVVANQISGAGSNYKVITVYRAGTAGATRSNATPTANPVVPADALAGYSGGGTSGGAYNTTNGARPGSGAAGTCFSGGAGGGGLNTNGWGAGYNGGDGGAYGGAGGNGISGGNINGTQYSRIGSGAAGNAKGTSQNDGTDYTASDTTQTGTGGLIFLVVGGTLTIGASGKIEARGMTGGSGGAGGGYGGGSGGGVINILYKTLSNSGLIDVTGYSVSGAGNQGGKGSTQIYQML